MANKMTLLGVAPKIALIFFPYLTFTIILQIIRPDIFAITQVPHLACAVLGTVLIIVGGILWALSGRTIQNAFKEGKLLTKGVYGIVRHPMYSGIIVFFSSGIALVSRSWTMLTAPFVGYIIFKLLIKEEEKYLERKFGQEYLDYTSKVNAIIPFPHFLK
jgi:protein-S-isoprenylcysteine O-methyltransferase Ste14